MSYTINKTDGSVLTTILDGTTNTDTGLTLIGRNYTGYGTVQNENFVRLLENFADPKPPGVSVGFTPIAGQLWWSTNTDTTSTDYPLYPPGPKLYVYNGSSWSPVNGSVSSATAPTALNVGDQWWDTVNQQLNVWNGTAWYLVGPAQSAGAAKSGVYSEQLADSVGHIHPILTTYSNGKIVSVFSTDTTFTISNSVFVGNLGVTQIKPGLNIPASSTIQGTADNSTAVGGVLVSQLARADVDTTFLGNVNIANSLVFNNAKLYSDSGALTINNTNFGKGTVFYNNTSSLGKIAVLSIDGASGLVTVAANPVADLGVATKIYVDTGIFNSSSSLTSSINGITASVAQLRSDTFGNIGTTITQTNANLSSAVSTINSQFNTVNTNIIANIALVNSGLTGANAAIASLTGQVNYNNTNLQTGINNANQGIITANTAMKNYVDYQTGVLTGQLTSLSSATTGIASTANAYTDAKLVTVAGWISTNVGIVNSSISTTQGQIITANAGATTAIINSYNTLKNYIDNLLGPLSTTVGGISLTGLAPINNPTFTGTVQAPNPTTHAAEQVATTKWVDDEITSKVGVVGGQIQKIYIDTNAPNNAIGNDGDVWLQIG